MTVEFITLEAEGVAVVLDLAVGHIRSLVVNREGRDISSLSRAPWIGETPFDDHFLPSLHRPAIAGAGARAPGS
jgi:hypothetical protein